VTEYLEVWGPAGPKLVPLEAERLTIGKAASNDVALSSDRMVSRLHAVLERFPAAWCVRDLGSSNGTFVNGERIWADRALRHADEIRIGKTRLVYRQDASREAATQTEKAKAPPELTRRERDVLVALCRPVLSGDVFTEPASIREIAQKLFVTEAAIKQHLLRLYDKFEIYEQEERRRVRLANDAIRRGAVTVADLRPGGGPT
jgi:hypothetical protein